MRLKHGPHSGKYLAECPVSYITTFTQRKDRLGDHARYILSVWNEYGLLDEDYNDVEPPF